MLKIYLNKNRLEPGNNKPEVVGSALRTGDGKDSYSREKVWKQKGNYWMGSDLKSSWLSVSSCP